MNKVTNMYDIYNKKKILSEENIEKEDEKCDEDDEDDVDDIEEYC
jgi:hypothetical protein